MTSSRAALELPRLGGRYALYDEIAAGGMATVHYGRFLGSDGFSRTVAIKRLHPQYAKSTEFVAMFMDEARLAGWVRHPNVAAVLDVLSTPQDAFLVMEYVHGESLSRLLRSTQKRALPVPLPILSSIFSGVLHGLHAAHEARGAQGAALGLVHRDVSPQNILVGADGITRVVDLGVAKAVGRAQITREGQLKGKLPYIAPEQLRGAPIDRRVDVYAAAVVLWEALAGRLLFDADTEEAVFGKVLEQPVAAPGTCVEGVPSALDAVVMQGLSRQASRRFATAREMALALEAVIRPATASEVGGWVESLTGDLLMERARRIAQMEQGLPLPQPVPELVASKEIPTRDHRPDFSAQSKPWRSLWLLGGLVVVMAALWLYRFATAPSSPPPVQVQRARPQAPAQVQESPAPPQLAPPDSTVVEKPSKRPSSPPAGRLPLRWCKVFDTQQQIFVVRQVRAATCP